ncbi:MAG TPA: serine hydrolase [Verrucomicrobiae bacterium]|nr:serine hydrolase [Verrucomicrobiae bacterium]
MKKHGSMAMTLRGSLTFAAVLFGLLATIVRAEEEASSSEWRTATPEEVGIDSGGLVEMFDYVREHSVPVHSVQIVRHGRLVLDACFHPYHATMRHDVASVTKSITSTLIGLAIDERHLPNVSQTVLSFFPARSAAGLDERKRKLTLEHLLTMQAGWDCGLERKEARLFEMRRSSDWLQFMLDLPMVAEPGTRFAYCSGNPHLLSIILSQVTGTNALAFGRRELFEPLGIHDVSWPVDPRGHNHGWGDLQMHPRDMAKLGQLFLQRGRWHDHQILSKAWIEAATRAHVERTVNRDHYGYLWWVKGEDYPGMFEAVGRGGQRINVWPAKDMVVVFTGGGFEPGDLGKFILKALKSDEPLRADRELLRRLQGRIAAAAKPPASGPVTQVPAMAALVSGKVFKLSANTLGLSTLALQFNNPAEAEAEAIWESQRVRWRVGLDGVERISTNTLVNLPVAGKGEWMSDDTFLLQLDLIGGINCYRFKLTFDDPVNKMSVTLSERTGLNEEQFDGVTSR